MSNLVDQIEVEITELEPCLKEVKYTIVSDVIKTETNEVVKEFTQYADLPGFRKGKVPATLVKNKFKDKINEELIQRFFSTAFGKSQQDENLDIITYSMDESVEPVIIPGSDFVFTIKYDVAPQFDIVSCDEIQLTKPSVEIDEKAVSAQLDYYKDVYAEYKTLDTPAAAGDMIKASYTSDFEIAEDAPLTAKNLVESKENWLFLSEPETIPGIIKGLEGAEAGKEYKLTSEFPADFKEEVLAGQTVNYTINVEEIQRRTPVASDEELCEKMQIDSLDVLTEQIKNNVAAEAESKAAVELKDAAMTQLLEKTAEFPFPPTVFSTEVNKQFQGMIHSIQSEEEAEAFKANKDENTKEAETKAKDRLRRFFIARAIANKEDIVVNEKEISEQIEMLSRHYGYSVDQLRQLLEQNGGMNDIQIDLLMNKVADHVVEKANVS